MPSSWRRARPDLILLDMKIPVLDGLTVTRLIRGDPGLKHVPILAVTGNAFSLFQAEALNAGCNHCFTKPIDFGHLEEVINTLVGSKALPVLQKYSLMVRSRGVMCCART